MTRSSRIYFIRPKGMDGPIKVGLSIYPATRIMVYACWSPIPLELAAQVEFDIPDGERQRKYGLDIERRFHARYAAYWMHHEWFAAHPLITRDIELIQNNRFRMSVLPKECVPLNRGGGRTDTWREALRAPAFRPKVAA